MTNIIALFVVLFAFVAPFEPLAGQFKVTSERDTYYPNDDDWRQFWMIEGPVSAIDKITIQAPGCHIIDAGRWSWDNDTFPDHPVPRFHIGEHGGVWWAEGADWFPNWDPNPTPGTLQIYTMSLLLRPSGQGIMKMWYVTGETESYKITTHKCDVPPIYLPVMYAP